MDLTNQPDFERFTTEAVSDDPTASEVAAAISEAYTRPEVTRVIAVFEGDVVEFPPSDIGSISATDGKVSGLFSETPSVDSFVELRTREKSWITDRLAEMLEMDADDAVKIAYQSRFGSEVEKTITVSEVDVQHTDPPFGYDAGLEGEHVDMVAVFGFDGGDEFDMMAQSNSGVSVLLNDTRVVEPGTYPLFEVRDNE